MNRRTEETGNISIPPGHELLARLGSDARITAARPSKSVTVFDLAGEIDYKNSPQLQHELRHATRDKPKLVVVNLRKVRSMDSSGVATLLDALMRAKRYGGRLRLAAPSREILAVMRICQLTDVFEILPSEREAIEA